MSKVKAFLQKWIINNLGFKILALVFAFILWLVITNTTDPVTTRTITGIPVQIQNESLVLDGTHVYTVISGSTATVVVSGNRSVVGTLTASDFEATADFAELSITNAVPIKVEMTGDKARYSPVVTINQKTNSMVIQLEDMSEESLDVEVQFNGQQPEGLIVEDAVASPAKVTFHAPESLISGAEKAVALVNYSEVSGDITLEKDLIIYGRDGSPIPLGTDVYLDQSRVSVKITTNHVKSVPINIRAAGTLKEGFELAGITYSKTSVSIRGDAEVLNAVHEITLPDGLLDVTEADRDVTITVDLANYLPEGTSLFGDTGTVTIVATVKPITEDESESETEKQKEKETETQKETDSQTETNSESQTETEEETTTEEG